MHPAVPVSAGPTGRGRTWDGMVAAWYGMGAHGRAWALMGAVMGTVLSQSVCAVLMEMDVGGGRAL